jgi:hypothetical protein
MHSKLAATQVKGKHMLPRTRTIRERALKVFSNIEALDDIKEMMLRALESPERAHTLLTRPPCYR